jgi:hypothetical protein
MRVWAKNQPFGAELVDVTVRSGRLSANGVAIGSEPCPYRLDYQLTTTDSYVTAQLIVRTEGPGWRRALALERAASGAWSCSSESGGDLDRPAPGGDMSRVCAGTWPFHCPAAKSWTCWPNAASMSRTGPS